MESIVFSAWSFSVSPLCFSAFLHNASILFGGFELGWRLLLSLERQYAKQGLWVSAGYRRQAPSFYCGMYERYYFLGRGLQEIFWRRSGRFNHMAYPGLLATRWFTEDFRGNKGLLTSLGASLKHPSRESELVTDMISNTRMIALQSIWVSQWIAGCLALFLFLFC